VAAPAALRRMRAHRLLRCLSEPARDQALSSEWASGDC
jgi:hypothetical protein